MDLVMPNAGLIFWQLLILGVVFFILRAKAWKPILEGLNKREMEIEGALKQAKAAEVRMKELSDSNEKLLIEARKERDKILATATDTAKAIGDEIVSKANTQADIILKKSQAEIEMQKQAAVAEIKNMVAEFSIDIAEKVLRSKLSDDASQNALVEKYMGELNLRKN